MYCMCGSQSSKPEDFLQKKTFFSKDCNHVPWLVSDVFVDGEDEHEHEEEASAAKEVPYVVPDIEIKSTRWDFHNKLTRHST